MKCRYNSASGKANANIGHLAISYLKLKSLGQRHPLCKYYRSAWPSLIQVADQDLSGKSSKLQYPGAKVEAFHCYMGQSKS